MRERLKELWQQARVPASSGWNRLGAAARRLGRWLGRTLALAGRGLGRALVATFSWQGGLLAARWILVLTVVAGLGFFLGRSRPGLLPTMPWEEAPAERLAQSSTLVTSPSESSVDPVFGEPSLSGAEPVSVGPSAPSGELAAEPPGLAEAPAGAQVGQEAPAATVDEETPPEMVLPAVDPYQMAVPVMGSLGQSYAWRRDAATQAWRLHDGVDLVSAPREPVTAALPGRVARVFQGSTGGLAVWIEHAGGWTTRYEALSEVFVVEGQSVAQGQAVGRVGRLDDGTSLGLHFAVYREGQPQDPARFLPALRP